MFLHVMLTARTVLRGSDSKMMSAQAVPVMYKVLLVFHSAAMSTQLLTLQQMVFDLKVKLGCDHAYVPRAVLLLLYSVLVQLFVAMAAPGIASLTSGELLLQLHDITTCCTASEGLPIPLHLQHL